jgi:hypothetical protein
VVVAVIFVVRLLQSLYHKKLKEKYHELIGNILFFIFNLYGGGRFYHFVKQSKVRRERLFFAFLPFRYNMAFLFRKYGHKQKCARRAYVE